MGNRARRFTRSSSGLWLPRPARLAKRIGRRDFVRTASGILAAATVSSACQGTESFGSGFGTVRVTITGLGPEITTAGSATIMTPERVLVATVQLPAAASGEGTAPVGTYLVLYSPPDGYGLAPGVSNETSVTVVENQTTDVVFSVVAATSTIRVTVSGIGAGAGGGGSAQILRTDVGGQAPTTVNVPTTGTVDSSVLPGTYSVTYTPPTDHQLSAGQANPQGVTVASGATATATFYIEVLGPPPAVAFHSDWSTGTGSTDAVMRDTGKAIPWAIHGGDSTALGAIIAAPGLDFPSANVFQVNCNANTGGCNALRIGSPYGNSLRIPPVGTSRYYRWYFRWVSQAVDDDIHPMQDGNGAALTNWQFNTRWSAGSVYTPSYELANGVGHPDADCRWYGPQLAANTTYRFEHQIHRIGANTFNLHVRVYNASGTLLYSDADFVSWLNASRNLSAVPTLYFRDVNNMDGLNCGANGVVGSGTIVYSYQGAFAVSDVDWCGPYSGGI